MKKANDVWEAAPLTKENEQQTLNPSFSGMAVDMLGGTTHNLNGGRFIPTSGFPFAQTVVGNLPVVNQALPYYGATQQSVQPIVIGSGVVSPFTTGNFPYQISQQPVGINTWFGNAQTGVTPQAFIAGTPVTQPWMIGGASTNPYFNGAISSAQTNGQFSQSILSETASLNGRRDFIGFFPLTNIVETEKSFRIELSVAGVSKENCKVGIDKEILWVTGTRKMDSKFNNDETIGVTKKEFTYGSFYRTFHLTENLDTEKIQCSCQNGLLTINILKREGTKKISSEISVG